MPRFKDETVLVLLFLLIFWTPLLRSEEELVQVKAYISRSAVRPGEEFMVALQVRIKKGWHINANTVDNEFLIPTSFSFAEPEGLRVVEFYYPEPKRGRFEYSESDSSYYENEVLFGVRLQTERSLPLGKTEMSGKLKYQACDDRSCRPPRTVPLKVIINVVPDGEETQATHPEIFSRIESGQKER